MTHPKPEPLPIEYLKSDSIPLDATTTAAASSNKKSTNGSNDQTVPVDLNLIEFDTK